MYNAYLFHAHNTGILILSFGYVVMKEQYWESILTICRYKYNPSPFTIHAAVNLGTLRLVSKTMAQQVPTLRMVIPYLELSTKQGYLVDRIKGLIVLICFRSLDCVLATISELSKGSNNLSAFRWNSGGSWKGRIWEQDLPNDSQVCGTNHSIHIAVFNDAILQLQIIMHLLCAYLDSQMPPNPKFPDGKAFSSQYFYKTPSKPGKGLWVSCEN